jgi:hypothetical protein
MELHHRAKAAAKMVAVIVRGVLSPQILNDDAIDKTEITCIDRNIRFAQYVYKPIMRFSR